MRDRINRPKGKGIHTGKTEEQADRGALLASGSNDPILDMLQTYLKRSYPEFYIFSANTGSTEGLKALNKDIPILRGLTSLTRRA